MPRLDQLSREFGEIERGRTPAMVLEAAEGVYQELAHYCAFADAYDAVRGDEPPLDLDILSNWKENAELGALRARHRRDHGEIGARAQAFTEGGYCTLYSEGMRLGPDDPIAKACSVVYDDEWEHMLHGIAGLEDQGLDPEGWALLRALTVEQMRLRIRMRNAQFGYPLTEARLREIDEGNIEPLPFDYRRAGLEAP
ncbi:MAG: hypothetical protein LC733_12545 [Actinobacteria bacterium]|nr:hypothetical protein [Actinomycetota bacterium]